MAPPPDNSDNPRPRLWSRLSNFSRKSLRSFTSSVEADDERSSSAEDACGMSSGSEAGGLNASPPRFHGEDTRPTSSKELAGWYTFSFAAETYVVCG